MANQIKVLFGEDPETIERYSKMSQSSQAEAMKFFVERFRSAKWKRTGIIWWNLIDGWPQFSDAVVDYYYARKLAYFVIKRSQQPLCLMFREPENGKIILVGANEYARDIATDYTVKDMTNGKIVSSGTCTFPANATVEIASVPFETDGMHFYLIEWNADGKLWRNHYVSGPAPYNFDEYYDCMCRSGLWQMDE
jgi:beta-mannosidase